MRTGMYLAVATSAVLGSVDAATLSRFPTADFENNLYQNDTDSVWSVDDFAQYDLTPIPMDDEYFA